MFRRATHPEWEVVPSISLKIGEALKAWPVLPGQELVADIDTEAAKTALIELQPPDAKPGTVHFVADGILPEHPLIKGLRDGKSARPLGTATKNEDGSTTVRVGVLNPETMQPRPANTIHSAEAHELQHAADHASRTIGRHQRRFLHRVRARHFLGNLVRGAMSGAAEEIFYSMKAAGFSFGDQPPVFTNQDYARKVLFGSPYEERGYLTDFNYQALGPVISVGYRPTQAQESVDV